MKALLSVLLGLMLFTSLVGISYATPILQPTQGSDNNNTCLQPPDIPNPNVNPLDCHGAHRGGDDPPPHGACATPGQRAPDVGACGCLDSITESVCCPVSITPHSLEVSDIQADVFTCGG